MCSHVLDNARLSTFYLGDFVFVAGGGGVYIERFIDGDQFVVLRRCLELGLPEFVLADPVPSSLERFSRPGSLDQDSPHRLRGRREEVAPVFPFLVLLA